ncbi:VOC family protein [Aerococcaceae bacterium DSM 111020]|nr:VOC family protein [Aerococcaceae bacterium DSM 111020]
MTLNPRTQSTTSIDTLFVTLNALNPERLAQFYTERIGLKKLTSDATSKWISLGTPDDIELIRIYETDVAKKKHTTGLYHLALLLPTRKDLGNILKHLIKTQTPLIGASDHSYSEAIYLDDPEGNGIEIYVDRDISDWTVNDDGTIPGIVEPMDAEGVLALADQEAYQGMPVGTNMGHVHLHVNNLTDVVDFYHDVLGLGVKFLMGNAAAFLATGEYHHQLGLNLWNGKDIPASEEHSQGLRTVIWEANADDFQEIIQRLDDNKYPFVEDMNYITLQDPAGTNLAVQKSSPTQTEA